jgi:predicted RecA/RadA family phage recombinase
MGAKYIQDDETVDYTPSSAVTAGDVIVQGDLVGVAKLDIAANRLGALAVEGVYDFPKSTAGGSAMTAGTKVYWDPTNKIATATAGVLKLLGKTTRDAADADATVRVRLMQ